MAMRQTIRSCASFLIGLCTLRGPASADATPDVGEAVRALDEPEKDIEWMELNEDAGLDQAASGNGDRLIADGRRCFEDVERLIAQHVPTDARFTVRAQTLTLGEAKAKICEPLAAKAATWDASIAAAKDGATDKAAAPYKAIGVTGDRLDLMVRHDGYAMYAVGGRELTSPKAKKAAPVIFELLGDSHSDWTLRRYQFKGDTLVATTERGFRVRPGAAAFR